MSDEPKKKVRVEMRKNRGKPPRSRTWANDDGDASGSADERVRAKGEMSRHRTLIVESGHTAADPRAAVDLAECRTGRVLKVQGLLSVVEAEDGTIFRCAVKRLLKTMLTDERHVVATGDKVWFRPAPNGEGMIERVGPRKGIMSRESRRREHVLVANVDQLAIVMSLVEPDLKPHLIDRYIASAIQGEIAPLLVLNKADLVAPESVQAIVGEYCQLGIPAILTSTKTGVGVELIREKLAGRATVFSGQSGVGKTSLLNALQPGLAMRVKSVSGSNSKGRHTTTTSELVKLDFGGYVVDTPGVRTLALWDVIPHDVEMFFAEFHPFVPHCGFPDCTHTHEEACAVKRAVDRRLISLRRYTSYVGMFQDALENKK